MMAAKKGSLSISSENIFPIIKKWVYSDHDIFVREMISNGCDAITKLKKLEVMGDYTFPEGHKNKIEVILNGSRIQKISENCDLGRKDVHGTIRTNQGCSKVGKCSRIFEESFHGFSWF